VGLSAALAQLHPARGTFTSVAQDDGKSPTLIGQMTYSAGNRSARLAFVAPGSAVVSPALTNLLEGLAWQAGDWGAFHLLGEVDELSPMFEVLRRTGFSVYAWQRIWRLEVPTVANGRREASPWQPVLPVDEPAIRSLFQNLVPPLVQSAEPLPNRRLRGLVYRQNGEIIGYVDGVQGPYGTFLHPVIHPDLSNACELVQSLVRSQQRPGRPVYLAIRSYQSWLEPTLADLPAESTLRHALLVKHLATLQRVPLTARLGVEKRSSEVPTASIVNHFGEQ
jgi:hypothetical protein